MKPYTTLQKLLLARNVIAGIPARRINLNEFSRTGKRVNPHLCGTVACAGGWLASHPKFNEFGLTSSSDGVPEVKGDDLRGYSALTRVFGITWDQSLALFQPKMYWERGTNKALWLSRCDWLIEQLRTGGSQA